MVLVDVVDGGLFPFIILMQKIWNLHIVFLSGMGFSTIQLNCSMISLIQIRKIQEIFVRMVGHRIVGLCPLDFHKLTTDVSWNPLMNRYEISWIIRNHQGTILNVGSQSVNYSQLISLLEGLAIFERLSSILDRFIPMIMESHSVHVISLITHKNSTLLEIVFLITQIHNLFSDWPSISFQYVSRNLISDADCLACEAMKLGLDMYCNCGSSVDSSLLLINLFLFSQQKK